MAGNKYVSNAAGVLTEVAAKQSSAGAGDAGVIPALDAAGRLDTSMMPVGVAADTQSIVSFENLASGDLVNIYNSSGTPKCRKADASVAGKEAHGFVLSAVTAPASATVYLSGVNTGSSGLTAGNLFLSDVTPGGVSASAPTTAAHIVQRVGVATQATAFQFAPELPITLA